MQKVEQSRKIVLTEHPLYKRLTEEFGFQPYNRESFPEFLKGEGFGMVVFLEDPNRMKETLDQLVIATELVRTYKMIKNRAVVVPPDARPLSNRYGFRKWPALVLLRDGKYLGAIDGLKEWADLTAEMNHILASEPTRPPTIGIPVNTIN